MVGSIPEAVTWTHTCRHITELRDWREPKLEWVGGEPMTKQGNLPCRTQPGGDCAQWPRSAQGAGSWLQQQECLPAPGGTLQPHSLAAEQRGQWAELGTKVRLKVKHTLPAQIPQPSLPSAHTDIQKTRETSQPRVSSSHYALAPTAWPAWSFCDKVRRKRGNKNLKGLVWWWWCSTLSLQRCLLRWHPTSEHCWESWLLCF